MIKKYLNKRTGKIRTSKHSNGYFLIYQPEHPFKRYNLIKT